LWDFRRWSALVEKQFGSGHQLRPGQAVRRTNLGSARERREHSVMMVSNLRPMVQAVVKATRVEAGLETPAPSSAASLLFRFSHRKIGF